MDTTSSMHTFSVPDYIVFGLLILLSIAIGVFFAIRDKKRNTTENYFLGDRKQKSLPVGLSFVVTFQSSVLILGLPAEVYAYGLQFSMLCFGVILGYLMAALIVVPIFHPLKVTSVYEYYQLRYNTQSVRYVAMALGVIHYTFLMGIVMFGTSLALESAAGLPFWLSNIIFSAAAIIYTSIGGFKAVIWTDVFQSVVMLSGILAVLIKTTIDVGGVGKVVELGKSRFNFLNFNPDPTQRHTFWTLVVGAPPQFFYLAITQAGIQRINSTPDIKTARRMFFIATPIFIFNWILVMIQGVAIYAYFSGKGCDPLASGQVRNLNQIIPFTVIDLFQNFTGFPGLFIAALAAASLSTISSGLSSLAAVTYEDIIKIYFPNMSNRKAINISKIVVVLFGLSSVGFAFVLSNVKGPLGQIILSLLGAIAGPEVGLFLLSVFFRRARSNAVIIATFTGVIFVFWISIGQNFLAGLPRAPFLPLGSTDKCPLHEGLGFAYNSSIASTLDLNNENFTATLPISQQTTPALSPPRTGLQTFYSISYMYFGLIGCLTVICVGIVISLFTKPKAPEPVSDKVVLPFSILVPSFLKKLFKSSNSKRNANVKPLDAEEMQEIQPLATGTDFAF